MNQTSKVVILAGGEGLRMKELTKNVPKGMLRLNNKTIIDHIMEGFKRFGYDQFIIAGGYKCDAIKSYYKKRWDVCVVDTGKATETGGRILKLKRLLQNDDHFFVCYADGLAKIDLKRFEDFHTKHRKIVSMVVTRPKSQFGVLKIKQGTVINFEEKPILPYWINSGFFIFNKEIFKHLDKYMFEKTTLPWLAHKKEIAAFKYQGFWKCMDTFKDYQEFIQLSKVRPWGGNDGSKK